jgi:hypothetical protein
MAGTPVPPVSVFTGASTLTITEISTQNKKVDNLNRI